MELDGSMIYQWDLIGWIIFCFLMKKSLSSPEDKTVLMSGWLAIIFRTRLRGILKQKVWHKPSQWQSLQDFQQNGSLLCTSFPPTTTLAFRTLTLTDVYWVIFSNKLVKPTLQMFFALFKTTVVGTLHHNGICTKAIFSAKSDFCPIQATPQISTLLSSIGFIWKGAWEIILVSTRCRTSISGFNWSMKFMLFAQNDVGGVGCD